MRRAKCVLNTCIVTKVNFLFMYVWICICKYVYMYARITLLDTPMNTIYDYAFE